LLNRVQNQGRMDLIHDYALHIPTTIIAEMLGVLSTRLGRTLTCPGK
jgi:cytochrome P450